jgi:hypothetical protein
MGAIWAGESSPRGRASTMCTIVAKSASMTSFPLAGQLILGDEAYVQIRDAIATATARISLCGAYVRSEALDSLISKFREGQRCRILARWQLSDLLSGASDLRAYQVAQQHGWEFYVRLNFHGKVYCVPPKTIVVGSANPTLSGFDLRADSNLEVCTVVEMTETNVAVLDRLFDSAVRVTPELFDSIRRTVDELPKDGRTVTWPRELELQMTGKPREQLFVEEFFLTDAKWICGNQGAEKAASTHDAALLGLESAEACASATPEVRRACFRRTAAYSWLVATLRGAGGECYFGGLTAALHSSLLDDPAPRRKEVKDLLQNLLGWLQQLELNEFLLDRPNHSQRLRLLE